MKFVLSFTKEKNKKNFSSPISLLLKIVFMQPTYSVSEIKLLIRSLDSSSILVLQELVEEEKKSFSVFELKAIHKFIEIKNKELVRNEVSFEFLLSFN